MTNLTDDQLTELLGAKCLECGHRGGKHRAGNAWQTACGKAEA